MKFLTVFDVLGLVFFRKGLSLRILPFYTFKLTLTFANIEGSEESSKNRSKSALILGVFGLPPEVEVWYGPKNG